MFYDQAKIELFSQFLSKIKEISGVSNMFLLLLLSLLYSEEKCGDFYTHENKWIWCRAMVQSHLELSPGLCKEHLPNCLKLISKPTKK